MFRARRGQHGERPELIAGQPPHWPEKAEDWLEEACSAAPGVALSRHEPVAHAPRHQPLKLIEGTVMKLILIAAAAVAFASTSAFACNGIYTPGVHCPQWEMMPMQTPQ